MANNFALPVYPYDKDKNTLLKAILPFMIIVHHIYTHFNVHCYHFIGGLCGDPAMYAFFAMSGYGLVSCYFNRVNYLDGFLKKSFLKLFIPYLTVLATYIIYQWTQGNPPLVFLSNTWFFNLVPTSWFLFCLALFYLFFYVVFKYINTTNFKRILIVSALVLAYYTFMYTISAPMHSYHRCPAFCVGMLVACYDKRILEEITRKQAFVSLIVFATLSAAITVYLSLPNPIFAKSLRFSLSIIESILLFSALYFIPKIPSNCITRFVSSISLEMFILQSIAINLIGEFMDYELSILAVLLVFAIDIILAYPINKLDNLIIGKISALSKQQQ